MRPSDGAPLTPERWRHVRRLFAEAAELPPDLRAAFLDRECAGDAGLRDEVDSLLAAERDAPAVLDAAGDDIAGLLAEDETGVTPAGRRVGPYRVIRELGRGGMGTVYLAERGPAGRRVALKVMRGALGSPENVRRFLLERRILGRLEHPAIARVTDGGVTDDGTPWFAMEYVAGEPIDRYCDDRRLGVDERLALFERVLGAVGHAHGYGVVHRDLKPSNILVGPDGEPKLIDFGIAKLLDDEGFTDAGPLTRTGIRVMTPEYAAPEQILGGPITPATDVHALGAILYELVSGARPRSLSGLPLSEIERRVRETEPPPPSVAATASEEAARRRNADPAALRDRLRGGLDHIVLRALAHDPADRYATTDELAADLRAHRSGSGLPAGRRTAGPGSSASARFRERARALGRTRAVRTGLAAAALGVVVLLAVWLAGAGRSAGVADADLATNRIAVLPFAYHGGEPFAYLREGLVDLLSTNLNGAGELDAVDPRAVLNVLPGTGRAAPDPAAARDVARRFGAGLYIAGSVIEADGSLRITAALHRTDDPGAGVVAQAVAEGSAEQLFDLVDRLTAGLLDRLVRGAAAPLASTAIRTTHSIAALKAYLEGEHHLRAGRFPTALAALEEAVARDSSFALAHYRLSTAANWLNRDDLAVASARAAVRHAGRLSTPDRTLVTAWERYLLGDPVRAERLYRDVLASHPDHVEAWLMLGEVQFHWLPVLGRPAAAARTAFERVLALEPQHVSALVHLARLAAAERRWTELDSIAGVVLALQPDGIQALEVQALQALGTGDEARRAATLQAFSRRSDNELWWIAGRLAAHLPDPERAIPVARLLVEPHREPAWRAYGHLLLAQLEAARGRWRAAERELDRVRPLEPGWAVQYLAAYAAMPALSVPPETLREVAAELERYQGAAAAAEEAARRTRPIFAPRADYSLALLALRAGDLETAADRIAPLERSYDTVEEDLYGPRLARQLRAELAAARGRHDEALATLGPPRPPADSVAPRLPNYPDADARFLRAELLAELGRDEEALRWLATFPDPGAYDLPYLAPSHLRRARIHDARGEAEHARFHYARFLDLWRDADPELRPALEEARERLAALGGSP